MGIPTWTPAAFFAVALVYSTAGFGGGSSYLALLALLGLPRADFVPAALACNVLVAGTSLGAFAKAGHLRFRETLPFPAASIPAAFLGARVDLSDRAFRLLLAFSLLAAGLRLFVGETRVGQRLPPLQKGRGREGMTEIRWIPGLLSGSLIGFLSGAVGLGGGIFLSPFLVLSGWMAVREASASASLFITANSLAGLLGRWPLAGYPWDAALPLGLASLAGGWIGSRLGAQVLAGPQLRRVLAALICCAALRMGAF